MRPIELEAIAKRPIGLYCTRETRKNLVDSAPKTGILLDTDVALAKRRFQVCKECPDVIGSGAGCSHHKGCCFGAWRCKQGNHCPTGKW